VLASFCLLLYHQLIKISTIQLHTHSLGQSTY
jgi:hypothetical protein